jgi:hypothetical protein
LSFIRFVCGHEPEFRLVWIGRLFLSGNTGGERRQELFEFILHILQKRAFMKYNRTISTAPVSIFILSQFRLHLNSVVDPDPKLLAGSEMNLK